jgi:hypothetical protein
VSAEEVRISHLHLGGLEAEVTNREGGVDNDGPNREARQWKS